MANPIAVALRGKGFMPMLERFGVITGHYGLNAGKIEEELKPLVDAVLAFGCAATLPVTAVPLARHPRLANKLQAQGMELAVHGLRHVDHTKIPVEVLVSNLRQALHIFEMAGIRATGFRSPYLRWNNDTLIALRICGFAYDSSQGLAWEVTGSLETASYQHVLEFYNAQSAAKHMALPRLEHNLVRIPYCLPDDEALIERLHLQDSKAMAEIWLAMLDRAYAGGELFTLGLHPERAPQCRNALLNVLEKARWYIPEVWIARLDEINRWQRALAQATFRAHQAEADGLRLTIQAATEVTLLVRAVEIESPAQLWAGKYRHITASEVKIHSNRRPWIGLAPDCPAALKDFLKQQGYLTETNPDPELYTFYLQRTAFNPEDERPLLAEIESGDWPLVRLARWPRGAKAALAVTGDMDAFTLWDYGQRVFNG